MNLGNIPSGYASNTQKCKEKVISEYYYLFLFVAAVLAQRPERLVTLAVATLKSHKIFGFMFEY